MCDHRLRPTILLILLVCSVSLSAVHGQQVSETYPATSAETPPVAPPPAAPISAAIPPTRAADPRAAEFAEKYNELQNQIFELVRKHREAKDDERRRIRDQIAELTTEQFHLRHQMRMAEIERIKKYLQKVEAKVVRRESLRKEIIEKRVTELLDEDAELRWEPLPIGGVRPQISTTTEMREAHLPDGTRRQVPTTILRDPQPAASLSPPQAAEPIPVAPRSTVPATPAATIHFPSLVGGLTVAEAKTRLEIAERKHERIRALAEQHAVATSELDEARDEVELAQLAYERASIEYEGRKKLLEVGVRRAEGELEKVHADLEESLSINQEAPGSIPAARVRSTAASVEEKKLALETAKTLLELHLLGADRTANVEGVVTLDGMPVANATVTFVPVDMKQGRPATGITDEDGTFSLKVTAWGNAATEPTAGVLPGDYYVGVVESASPEKSKQRTVVPKKYNDPRKSGLKVTVKKGSNKIDIHLASE